MAPLAKVAPGTSVVLESMDASLDARFREQLAAYGVSAGRPLWVLQQRPVTVIVCDHVEIALERVVARALIVALAPDVTPAPFREEVAD